MTIFIITNLPPDRPPKYHRLTKLQSNNKESLISTDLLTTQPTSTIFAETPTVINYKS